MDLLQLQDMDLLQLQDMDLLRLRDMDLLRLPVMDLLRHPVQDMIHLMVPLQLLATDQLQLQDMDLPRLPVMDLPPLPVQDMVQVVVADTVILPQLPDVAVEEVAVAAVKSPFMEMVDQLAVIQAKSQSDMVEGLRVVIRIMFLKFLPERPAHLDQATDNLDNLY